MNSLITIDGEVIEQNSMMPLMDLATVTERFSQVAEFVQSIMKDGKDFGVIPGTTKPTLFKPGAEKLTTFFGLTKRFDIIEKVEDWNGENHKGEPFFYYLYRCSLWRGSLLIAESDGSCNSFEVKYRYRKSERICPICAKPAIIKGKAEYGGGWVCWKQKDGCGSKFSEGDKSIEQQEISKIPNPDICDQVNTFQKMAQKRALIAATLLAVNASDFFTQDVEDYIVSSDKNQPPKEEKRSSPSPPKQSPNPKIETGEVLTSAQLAGFDTEPKTKAADWPAKEGPIFEFCQEVLANTEHYKNQYQLKNAIGGFTGNMKKTDIKGNPNDNYQAKLSAALDHAREEKAAQNG